MQSSEITRLKKAIEKFETCLITPVVSGELEAWTTAVQQAYGELVPVLQSRLASKEKDQLNQISEQDSELLPRVEQLRQQRDELLTEAIRLGDLINRVDVKSERVEPNEGLANKDVSETVSRGLAFVLQCRSHEVALDTWFNEAFNRDRGVAD
jgi:hypothetical protein